MRLGQLSMSAGAMVERWMSASDWVAKTTETFFLRRVFSHSRMRPAKSGIIEKHPRLIQDEQVGGSVEALPPGDERGKSGPAAPRSAVHQLLHLKALHSGLAQADRDRHPAAARRDPPRCRAAGPGADDSIAAARRAGERALLDAGRCARLAERRPDGIPSLPGSISTPSCARRPAIHSAAQARVPSSSMRASG